MFARVAAPNPWPLPNHSTTELGLAHSMSAMPSPLKSPTPTNVYPASMGLEGARAMTLAPFMIQYARRPPSLLIHIRSVSPSPSTSADRKSTRLNSSHPSISYAVFCLKKKSNVLADAHLGRPQPAL